MAEIHSNPNGEPEITPGVEPVTVSTKNTIHPAWKAVVIPLLAGAVIFIAGLVTGLAIQTQPSHDMAPGNNHDKGSYSKHFEPRSGEKLQHGKIEKSSTDKISNDFSGQPEYIVSRNSSDNPENDIEDDLYEESDNHVQDNFDKKIVGK
jgi:hypothetical protein